VSLEEILGDFSTFGGHSFEIDGMYQVDVWVEPNGYYKALNSLYFPRILDGQEFFQIEDFQYFIRENPGDYFIMFSEIANILQLQGTLNSSFLI
jgi:hypothetical protein